MPLISGQHDLHGMRGLGIDRSEAMIERAQALTFAERLHHVDYVCADVERYAFSPRQFDIAISRFGTMFFADAVAAFSSIRLALGALGRLVMLVWQSRERSQLGRNARVCLLLVSVGQGEQAGLGPRRADER